jgi:hypothetical protein
VSLDFSIQTLMYSSYFLPKTFVLSLPESPLHFFQDLMHTCCSFVRSITKSHEAKHTTTNKCT